MKGSHPARESLREQKKLETRERIRRAASRLFTQRGYGAATMRQIAKRAHVGLGTLFNYAEDKRDLVFLIFNEELNAITDVALAAPRPGQALVDQLLAVFRVHYGWLATKPALARILLQELTFYSSGKQAATFHGIRTRLSGVAFARLPIRSSYLSFSMRFIQSPSIQPGATAFTRTSGPRFQARVLVRLTTAALLAA